MRPIRETEEVGWRTHVRLAAAAIGGAGAALGAVVCLLAALGWIAIVLLSGDPSPNLVDVAFVGTMAEAVTFCAAGAAGAWLVFRHRTRRGALLMLVAALGIAAVLLAQPFLVDAAGDRGLPERITNDSEPSLADQPLARLAPAGTLLVGAALALLAPGRRGGTLGRDSGA